jgi:hypothetical protein
MLRPTIAHVANALALVTGFDVSRPGLHVTIPPPPSTALLVLGVGSLLAATVVRRRHRVDAR